jgi:tetratricopeptide (TPR) repeat protein
LAPVTRQAADEPVITAEEDLDIGERTSLWLDSNAKLVNLFLGILVVLALGWTVYRWIHQGRQANASRAYALVLDQFNTAENEQDEAKRRDSLNAAITAGDTVIKDYPKQFVGRQAQLLVGNANYELASLPSAQGPQALNNAREAYTKYISMADDPQEKAVGNLALGNVLQDQLFITQDNKLVTDAETAYKQAIDLGRGTYVEAEAKLALANMYQAFENRQADAEKLYREVAESRDVKPAPADGSKAPTASAASDTEHTLTPEQMAEVKSFAKMSYAERAKRALDRLPALKVAK